MKVFAILALALPAVFADIINNGALWFYEWPIEGLSKPAQY